jgi:hypothetical protein
MELRLQLLKNSLHVMEPIFITVSTRAATCIQFTVFHHISLRSIITLSPLYAYFLDSCPCVTFHNTLFSFSPWAILNASPNPHVGVPPFIG